MLLESRLTDPGNPGFAFRNPSSALFYGWHSHACHQITYARSGTTQIEGPDGHHLLPAGHAVWVPANTRHRTMIRNLNGVSVYFHPAHFSGCSTTVLQTFPVTSMVADMLFHTLRWPAGCAAATPLAHSFFQAVWLLCLEQMQNGVAGHFTLPRATHPSLIRAMDSALAHLSQASLAQALNQAGMSERSFRRHFYAQTGMAWQDWLIQARLFQAATFLAEGQRVTDVAAAVGYASLSAFAKAFRQFMGQSPAAFRAAQKEKDILKT